MSLRLAAYGVCIEDGRVLLARFHKPSGAFSRWTLPGGGVDPSEDPFDAVIRELTEETGCDGLVERLLGVDSRITAATETASGDEHQDIGIFYQIRITGGVLRPEPDGDLAGSVWTPLPDVVHLHRTAVVDIGLALAHTRPATGHLDPVQVSELIQPSDVTRL